MKLMSGVKLLDETVGQGAVADNGDSVIFNMRLYLNHGGEVPLNQIQAKTAPPEAVRELDGVPVLDREIVLGKRHAVPAVEYALLGMQAGGYRKIKASPHLAYGEQGVPNLIPGNAALVAEIWLQEVR